MSNEQSVTPGIERHESLDGLAVFVEDEENFDFHADLLPGSDAWHIEWMYELADKLGLARVDECPPEILEGAVRYWYSPSTVEAV